MSLTDSYDKEYFVANRSKRRKEKIEKANFQVGAVLEMTRGQNNKMKATVWSESGRKDGRDWMLQKEASRYSARIGRITHTGVWEYKADLPAKKLTDRLVCPRRRVATRNQTTVRQTYQTVRRLRLNVVRQRDEGWTDYESFDAFHQKPISKLATAVPSIGTRKER